MTTPKRVEWKEIELFPTVVLHSKKHEGPEEQEKGMVSSRKSLATFILKLVKNPQMHVKENLGINKPNS